MIQSNIGTSAILEVIEKKHKIYISPNTISKIKEQELDDLFEQVKKVPHGHDVERLLAMMGSMDDISYVYVFHEPDSGLVVIVKHAPPRIQFQVTQIYTGLSN